MAGYPCHDPHFNAAKCESVLVNSSASYLRENNPGSMQFDQWEDEGNQQCTIQAPRSASCSQGRVSVLGIQAESIEDVQKAVRFAVKRNLRLVVKSSGHDYLGRSAAAESFLLWMHKLNKSITITTAFVATQVLYIYNEQFIFLNESWLLFHSQAASDYPQINGFGLGCNAMSLTRCIQGWI